jgi:two-component system chemotaxis response regulator CheY
MKPCARRQQWEDSRRARPAKDEFTVKTLIVEDDLTSRMLLQEILKHYGHSHVAVNGKEAVEAVCLALEADEPYDLICLDIMMPEMDGQQALKEIRALERTGGPPANPARIIMTSALGDRKNVMESIQGECDAFLVKPISRRRLIDKLAEWMLIA